jgi:hypothetical protein
MISINGNYSGMRLKQFAEKLRKITKIISDIYFE